MHPSLRPLRRAALRSSLLAVAVCAAVAPALLHAQNTYFPVLLVKPTGTLPGQVRQVVSSVNTQGYAAFTDNLDPLARKVYANGRTILLAPGGLDASKLGTEVILSDTAADGSFRAVTTYVNTAAGKTRAVIWTVLADDTSTVQELRNFVLPENSQQPGEQSAARPLAVDSRGHIVGQCTSYLVSIGVEWFAPDPTCFKTSTKVDIDEAGNTIGFVESYPPNTPGYSPGGGELQAITFPFATRDNLSPQINAIRGTRYVGNYAPPPDASGVRVYTRAFIADAVTGAGTLLPPLASGISQVNDVSDYAYQLSLDGSVVLGDSGNRPVLWRRDPATGAYAVYDLGSQVLRQTNGDIPGTKLTYTDNKSGNEIAGVLPDGTLVVQNITDREAATAGHSEVDFLYLRYGVDPRPRIVGSDGQAGTQIKIAAQPGEAFSYQPQTTTAPTGFLLKNNDGGALPAGVNFDPATGKISGVSPKLGYYAFELTATGSGAIGAFSSGVLLTSGSASVVTSAATATGSLNQPFSFQVTANNSPSQYFAEGLPAGLQIDSQTGLISGTPTQAGTFNVTLRVSNPILFFPEGQALTITVDDKPPAAFRIAISEPAGGALYGTGAKAKAKAKVDLTGAGGQTVASVVFLLDGQPVGSPIPGGGPYKVKFAAPTTPGAHVLAAVATGADGRKATSAGVTLNVQAPFVDLALTGALKVKSDAAKIKVKGAYSLANLGNVASRPTTVSFFLSDDATFDPARDRSIGELLGQATGVARNLDLPVPALPAGTTVSSLDPAVGLPALNLKIPQAAVMALGLRGKYVLAVIDPANDAGEPAEGRTNNVVAVLVP